MRVSLGRLGALFVIASFVGLVALARVTAVRADTTRNWLRVSSIDELLNCTRGDDWVDALALSQGVSKQLGAALGQLPGELTSPVFRTVSEGFGSSALSARFRELVAARAEPAHTDRLIAFCRSALGRRYASVDRQARPQDLRAWLAEHPVSAARRSTVEHWVDVSFAMERLEAGMVLPVARVARAVSAYQSRGTGGQDAADIGARIRSPELKESVVDHFLYALRDFNDPSLAELVRFESTPDGRWYRQLELDAMTQVLDESFEALEREMVSLRERVTARFGTVR